MCSDLFFSALEKCRPVFFPHWKNADHHKGQIWSIHQKPNSSFYCKRSHTKHFTILPTYKSMPKIKPKIQKMETVVNYTMRKVLYAHAHKHTHYMYFTCKIVFFMNPQGNPYACRTWSCVICTVVVELAWSSAHLPSSHYCLTTMLKRREILASSDQQRRRRGRGRKYI